MTYGVLLKNSSGVTTFDSTTSKAQRIIKTGLTTTSNGSTTISDFDTSGGNGYFFIAPVGNSYKDALPALSWDNSTKVLTWTFHPNPTVATNAYAPLAPSGNVAARYYAIMSGGAATSGQTGFGFQLKRADGNVIIDDKFRNLCTTTTIGTYSGSGLTPGGYSFGICYASPSAQVYSSTISNNNTNFDANGRFPVIEMGVNTIIFPRMYGEDVIEWDGTTSVRAVSVSQRSNTNDFVTGTHGFIVKDSEGAGVAFADTDLHPEIVYSNSFNESSNFLWSGGNTGSPDYYDITIDDPQGEPIWGLLTITAAPMGIASGRIAHNNSFTLSSPALKRTSNTTFRLSTYTYLQYGITCSNPSVDEGNSTLGTNYGEITAHVTLFKIPSS